jgi:cytochrome c556
MQDRKTLVAGLVVALSLALVGLAVLPDTGIADDEKIIVPQEIQKAVNQIADKVASNKDVDQDTAALFKQEGNNLKKIMWIFKPRMAKSEGGFGIGPKAGAYEKDGIEVLIIIKGNPKPRTAEQKVTKEELEKHGEDYIRAMDVTIAMAEIAQQYKPTKKLPGQNPANWTRFADDMKKAAIDVKAAVTKKDPDTTKAAFIKLYSSCTNCHSNFRDRDDSPSDPPQFLKAFNSMADAVGKGQKIDKDADAFFKDNKNDLKNVKYMFQAHPKNGRDGLRVGPNRGTNTPDDVESYVALQGNQGVQAMTQTQLKLAAGDLNRLADVMIVMAIVMERFKPKSIVIGGPTGVAQPADWTASVDAMKQGAVDLKAAVKANKPDDAKIAFKKIQSSCVTCHHVFRD